MGAFGTGLILLAAAGAVLAFGTQPVAGLAPDAAANLLALVGMGCFAAGTIIEAFRGGAADVARAVITSSLLLGGAVGFQAYRGEIEAIAGRIFDEPAAGPVEAGPAGEAVVNRRRDGSFLLAGRANGQELRFIFDTGASTVVLTAEGAAWIGLDPAGLRYVVPVATANGRTLAAPVVLDSLSVGPITERRVRTLVAQPGALHENLLGMSFLDRLTSYEVRQGQLILRGRKA